MDQTTSPQSEKKNGIKVALTVLVIGLLAFFGLKYRADDTAETPAPDTNSGEPVASGGAGSKYKDGTYNAEGTYTSPAGEEKVGVTVTLKNDIITGATFDGKATHPISKKLQDQFATGFTEVVAGKPIDEVSLTVVNGSSLVPKGFMDALEDIKTAALAQA